MLKNLNYTIIQIDQISPAPNPKRDVVAIYGPGVDIEPNTYNSNYFCSIIINNYIYSLCLCETSTGHVYYTEHGINNHKYDFFSDIYRIIHSYGCNEFLIYSSEYDIDYIKEQLGISEKTIHFFQNYDNSYNNISYQQSFLSKSYNINSDNVIYILDMHRHPDSIICLICCLEWIKQYNEQFILNLKKPILCKENDSLILYSNTIYQLNIIPTNKNKSLLDIIDFTKTAMGKRLLKFNLINPTSNISQLNESYSNIEKIINKSSLNQGVYINDYSIILEDIYDLERIFRKFSFGKVQINDIINITFSYEAFKKLINIKILDMEFLHNLIFIDDFITKFNMTNVAKCSRSKFNKNIFVKDFNPELDTIVENIENLEKIFIIIFNNLNPLFENNLKYELNDSGYSISISKTRYNKFTKENKINEINIDEKYKSSGHTIMKIEKININSLEIKKNTSNVKISHDYINKINTYLINNKEKQSKIIEYLITNFVKNYYSTYKDILNDVVSYISIIDYYSSLALSAKTHRYYKPTINETYTKSYIEATEIRHPIVENIQTKIPYISNNITLDNDTNGIMIYGVNGGGKSILMKSIGLNIILAQMGSYVASTQFNYFPFKNLMTRITGNDDLHKGDSSFDVEMGELKPILNNCNEYSLVLGDEIARGTESISGLSIVGASIKRLDNKNSKFLFATHLHDINKIDGINNNDRIKHYYLDMEVDNEGNITYNRKLKSGIGPSMYGLEVCRGMGMDNEFLKDAFKIRNKIENHSVKKSKYNSKVELNMCNICNEKKAYETDHIEEQQDADNDGYIGNYNKNRESNLVGLCKDCHLKKTNGEIYIFGWKMKNNSRILEWKYTNQKKSRKKLNDEHIKFILSQKDFNKKILLKEFEKKYFKLSMNIMNKVLSEKY